jgi:hypothetical protein
VHASVPLQLFPAQQAPPSVPHGAQLPPAQSWSAPQTRQLAPVPQAEAVVPGSQPLASQQPLQEAAVQLQAPPEHSKPSLQAVPQQLWPTAPQLPVQLPPVQPTSVPQTLQLPPPEPQAVLLLPVSQPPSSQQPAQELALQTQAPFEQARVAWHGLAPLQQVCPGPPQLSHLPPTQA